MDRGALAVIMAALAALSGVARAQDDAGVAPASGDAPVDAGVAPGSGDAPVDAGVAPGSGDAPASRAVEPAYDPDGVVVMAGTPEVPAGYDVASVRRVLRAHRGAVQQCFADHDHDGAVHLRIALDERGRVASARVPALEIGLGDLDAFALAECLTGWARRWRFAPPASAPAELVVPLRRRSTGSGYGGVPPGGRRREVEPRVAFRRPDVRGSLTRGVILRVVRRHEHEVRFCYELELGQRPDLAGRVTVSFIISATGAVQTAVISSTTLSNARVEGCLSQAVRRWAFPAPREGVVGVNLPIELASVERRSHRPRASALHE